MSGSDGGWGDMIIPGVYMIQRTPKANILSTIVQPDGTLNLELLHLEIDELQRHIELLRKSNVEIAAYLKEKRENGEEDEEGGGMSTTVALSSGATEEEDDDAVFLEALEENVLVITNKERELEQLRELIKGQRCGCGGAHSHQHGAEPDQAAPSPTGITL